MARRLIGTGITNAQGIAIMNKDAQGQTITGYTGVGAGKLQIIAESGTLQSETYSLIDGIFYDSGTSSSTATWTNWTTYEPLLERGSEYCAIKVDTAQSKTLARMYKQFDISSAAICIEFDIRHQTSNDGEQFATLRNNSAANRGNMDLNRFGGQLNTWHHIKIEINTTNVKVYLDDSTTAYTYNASDVTRFYWDIDPDTTEVDFKNFVIYPI